MQPSQTSPIAAMAGGVQRRLTLAAPARAGVLRRFSCLLTLLGIVSSAWSLGTIVPAYFYPVPGSPWVQLNDAARRIPVVAIMNPGNGPGTATDANYAAAVGALQAAGGKVIGYVHTSYTARPLNDVKANVTTFFALYPSLDGIFVDEMTNDASVPHQTYYLNLKAHIRALRPGAMIVGNPGTQTLAGYLSATDTLVTYEGGEGYGDYATDAWTFGRAATNFSHLCYAIPTPAAMSNCVALAVSRNVGWVFVTHDVLPNPWDTLPPYWTAEVALLESLNRPRLSLYSAPAGSLELRVQGGPGNYAVETSPDLAAWSGLVTNTLATNGTFSLPITNRATAARQFLRARFVCW
jgi:hypothetical protein